MSKLIDLWQWLKGKKTYFAAAGMILYAILGLALGQLSHDAAMVLFFNALGIAGLKHGQQTGS